jgi:hypothetical protein
MNKSDFLIKIINLLSHFRPNNSTTYCKIKGKHKLHTNFLETMFKKTLINMVEICRE